MKKELSSVEIFYLVKEFGILKDAKVSQVYHPDKKQVLIQLFIPSQGKKFLRFDNKLIYLSDFKEDQSSKPSGFCMALRKKISGARVRDVFQVDDDRIIEFMLERKEGKFKLLFELFDKTNIFVLDEHNKILLCEEQQRREGILLRPGEQYPSNTKECRFSKISKDELIACLENSSQKKLVKKLAIELGLGGNYAEEICKRADINKNLESVSDMEVERIHGALRDILSEEISPVVAKVGDTKKVFPFSMSTFPDAEKKDESFSDILDEFFSKKIKTEIEEKKEKKKSKETTKVERMISAQKSNIEKMKKLYEKYNRLGEIIYENFQEVETILNNLKDARKEMSWEEIKMKISNPKIKEINEKDSTIVLELPENE